MSMKVSEIIMSIGSQKKVTPKNSFMAVFLSIKAKGAVYKLFSI